MKRILLFAMAVLLVATTSAFAIDIPITNAGMEMSVGIIGSLVDGADQYTAVGGTTNTDGWRSWANAPNGSMLRIWNPSPTDRSSPRRNEFFDTSWGGVAPEGSNVLAVRTQVWDYGNTDPDDYGNRQFSATTGATDPNTGIVYDWQTDSGGVRDFEAAAQQLTATFDPTARYTLTVQVGRLSEGTGPSYDNSGLNAGVVAFDGSVSTRFANDAPALWGGYNAELMAGGVTAGGATWSGWVYGTTADPADADYIGAIASDSTGLTLAQDTWGLSTVSYLPNPATWAAMNALAGKNLVIRLAAPEIAGQHQNTTVAAFDDVKLVKFIAGDANMDDDVDVWDFDGSGDAQVLSENIGTPIGATWAEGDFNGDGDVDVWDLDGSGDAQILSNNLGYGVPADVGQDAAVGTAEALYNVATGELSFDIGARVAVVGIGSAVMYPGAVNEGSIFGAPIQSNATTLAYFDTGGLPVGEDSVGLVLPPGLTAADMTFSYTPTSGPTQKVDVTIVPEPSTLAMLGVLCAIALCWRRRRS